MALAVSNPHAPPTGPHFNAKHTAALGSVLAALAITLLKLLTASSASSPRLLTRAAAFAPVGLGRATKP